MAQKTKVAVAKMQAEMDEKGYCDVNKWFIFMVGLPDVMQASRANRNQATDIVTEAAFGEAFGLLELGKVVPSTSLAKRNHADMCLPEKPIYSRSGNRRPARRAQC